MKYKSFTVELLIISCVILTTILGCDECKDIACLKNTKEVKILLLENGKPFVGAGDLQVVLSTTENGATSVKSTTIIGNMDSVVTVELCSNEMVDFEINERKIGTFELFTKKVGNGMCCELFEIDRLNLNGNLVCDELCSGLIRIDL